MGRRVEVVTNAAQVCNRCRKGPLWNDRVFGRSGEKAGPNVWMGWLLGKGAGDG